MLRICSTLVLICVGLPAWADISGRVRVIDADTVDIGQTRVRLYAIDAPEMDQTCLTEQGVAFACGLWASAQVATRFEGAQATCRKIDMDRYGRTVATCRARGVDMGQEIVSQGWAFAYRRYGMDYDLDEKSAYVATRGLHGFAVQSPAQFRKTRAGGNIPPDPKCRIKGNISKNGRIYHLPGQEFYDRTRVDVTKGERWFCSASDARDAGWRSARR